MSDSPVQETGIQAGSASGGSLTPAGRTWNKGVYAPLTPVLLFRLLDHRGSIPNTPAGKRGGGEVRIIACIEDAAVIEKILAHLDAKAAEPQAPRRRPSRAPHPSAYRSTEPGVPEDSDRGLRRYRCAAVERW